MPREDLNTTAGDVGWENAPSHYKGSGGLENFDVWDAYELDPYSANAFKYLARWDKKGSPVNDLKKALHYVTETRIRVGRSSKILTPGVTIMQVLDGFGLYANVYVAEATAYLLRWACDRKNMELLEAAEDAIRHALVALG